SQTVGRLVGVESYLENATSGTVPLEYGMYSDIENENGGVITSANGLYTTIVNDSGSITNGYGLYIDSIQATNKWSIYASDSTASSYFAGKVGVGTTLPQAGLDIATTGSLASAVLLPRDTTGN